MRSKLSRLIKAVVLVSLLAHSSWAFAQESSAARVLVFDAAHLPAANTEVLVDGIAHTTDADGALVLDLTPGHHELKIGESQTTMAVVEGQSVEVLITLSDAGAATFDVEGAEAPEKPVEVEAVASPGQVRGVVRSLEGAPIAGVRVFVRGVDVETQTDSNGAYSLEVLPGTYDLSFVHSEFSTQESPGVVVKSEDVAVADVALSPASVMLDEFTVSAPRIEGGTVELLAERRDSIQVMEIIGAEQMSKSGASSAADALSRVTGITVVGGKYVYVRGLGERYSSTLLNGSTLPSPDPERRVVPLDIFPTEILESVSVQKNYSANMPGEFGGGVVELRTKRIPEEFEASMGGSLGYRAGSTFEDAPDYEGGAWDWLGFDDGTRALPDVVEAASEDSPIKAGDRFSEVGYSDAELEEFGKAMPNTWAKKTQTMLPNMSVDGSIGDKFELGGGTKAGMRLGLTYDKSNSIVESTESYYRVGADNQLELRNSYDFIRAGNRVVLGGILNAGLDFGENHHLTSTTIIDRVSDDNTRVYSGFNRDAGDIIRVTRNRWVERTLLYQQLQGEHVFPGLADLGVDWSYVFSQAQRSEPDTKETRYDRRNDGRYRLSDRPEGNSRFFSTLVDNNHDIHLDTALPFDTWTDLEATARSGLQGVVKNREATGRRYKNVEDSNLILQSPELSELFYQSPEEIFSPDNIGVGLPLQFQENTRSTDNYRADQLILAGYGLVDLPLSEAWLVSAGARLEYSDQNVETFELFNPDGDVIPADLETLDVLPSLSVGWKFVEAQQLRFAYGRTVSRPDFRELSPLLFDDVAGGRAVQGNPDLERALINHLDLRWEWFPTARELVSASLFGKYFESPIESELQPGAQPLLTFQNAESATNVGVEVESRVFFEFVSPMLRDLFVSTNVALIYSSVSLAPGGSQTNTTRPLQGQSPYVVNASVGYDNVDSGISATLLYSVAGRRIESVGALGAPDTYREPIHRLDLVYKHALGGGLKLSAKANNLLDSDIEQTQGGNTTSTSTVGRKASLGLEYSF